MAVAINSAGARLKVHGNNNAGAPGESAQATIQLQFPGSQTNGAPQGETQLPGNSNYFIGTARDGWHTAVPAFRRVSVAQLYPGIDLIYHGDRQVLEYDFRVAPGADPTQIALQFTGADGISLNDQGDLILQTPVGPVLQQRPVAYQQIGDQQQTVTADYQIAPNGEVHLQLAAYNTEQELIIDPVLVYSTFYGGAQDDKGLAIAVDDQGSAYIAGTTLALDFPLQSPLQPALNGGMDAFVLKLSADGQTVAYATYIGGGGADGEPGDPDDDDIDTGKAVAVTSTGELVMTGTTSSTSDFPLVNALQPTYGGGNSDAYLLKLAADGQNLLFFYLPGWQQTGQELWAGAG